MSSQEMYFSTQSRYPKVSPTAMPVDEVEAWLNQFPQKRAENKPNGGIIKSIADTSDMYLREMSPRERKVARAKAQREHREALKNLAKQDEADAKKIAKQLTKWRRESKKKVTEMPTVAGQEVLDAIKENGFYDVSDFKQSGNYLRAITTQIRALGYSLKPIRKGMRIVRYVLGKQ
jgi:hypothetical protein